MNVWSQRDLTPIGKIAIVKSLALSQLTYMFSILPNPSQEFMKKVEKALFKFIWNNKPDKVKREVLYSTKENGGLKMTNIAHFSDALKIAWVKRYMQDENNGKWKTIFKNEKPFSKMNFPKLVKTGFGHVSLLAMLTLTIVRYVLPS